MDLHTWLQMDHGGNRTNICRTIKKMDAAQPVRAPLARAKQMPNLHDVSSVELTAAMSAWLQAQTPAALTALAQDCWGNDEQEA